jgi:flagellar protein FliO/FliZ
MTQPRHASFHAVFLSPLSTPRARLRLPGRLAVILGACALAVALLVAGGALAALGFDPSSTLPAARSPAATTAHLGASSNSQPAPEWVGKTAGGGALSDLLSLAMNLGIVLALLYGTLWLLRRLGPAGLARHGRSLRVIESASLGQGRSLVVVEAGERRLLLGVTAQQISLVSELPAEAAPPRERHS